MTVVDIQATLTRLTRWGGFFVGACALIAPLDAAQLRNLSVPSSAVRGGVLNISFELMGPTWSKAHYAVAYSAPGAFVCQAPHVWAVTEKGVYGPGGSPCPDYIGAQGGVAGDTQGASPVWQVITLSLKVPEDAPDSIRVNVMAHDYDLQATRTNCPNGPILGQDLSLSGPRQAPRLDLQPFQSNGIDPQKYKLAARITNWGVWPVALNDLCLRYWFHDTHTGYVATNYNNNQTIFNAANQGYLNNVGTVSTSILPWSPAADCGDGRKANQLALTCFTQVSASVAVPGCGGYMTTANGNVLADWRRSDWGNIDYSDDYSRQSDVGVGNAGRGDTPYVQLMYDGAAACEEKTGGVDANAGAAPCGQGGCGEEEPTATVSATVTATATPTATSTVTATPTSSPIVEEPQCPVLVEYRNLSGAQAVAQPVIEFQLTNLADTPFSLARFNIAYIVGSRAWEVEAKILNASKGSQELNLGSDLRVEASSFHLMEPQSFLQMLFSADLSLGPGEILLFQLQYHRHDEQAIDQAADPSYSPSQSFVVAERLITLCNGFESVPAELKSPCEDLTVTNAETADFLCLLWNVQRRHERVSSARATLVQTGKVLRNGVNVHSTEDEIQTLHFRRPSFVKGVTQKDGIAGAFYLRNGTHLIQRFGQLGLPEQVRALVDCPPMPGSLEWILPLQVTRPYNVFAALDFNYKGAGSSSNEHLWEFDGVEDSKTVVGIDMQLGLITFVEYHTVGMGQISRIEGIEYIFLGNIPLLKRAVLASYQEGQGSMVVSARELSYDYINVNPIDIEEEFR